MFTINSINLPVGKIASINEVAPILSKVKIGEEIGQKGSMYTINVSGLGSLKLMDIGNTNQASDTNGISINGTVLYYNGNGKLDVTIKGNGNVTVSSESNSVNTSLISVTLHQNMGYYDIWHNPNVFIADKNGTPTTPRIGVECYLWSNVQNNGILDVQYVTVTFFCCNGTTNTVWPKVALGTGACEIIKVGETKKIMCLTPWIPDSRLSTHQCLAAVATFLDGPVPDTTPDVIIDANNSQIAQQNMNVYQIKNISETANRYFNINKTSDSGYIKAVRMALSDNSNLLISRGIDPNIGEAPSDEKITIVRQSDGLEFGDRMDFNAGESHELFTKIDISKIKPGTASIYQVQHFENDILIGGVSQVIIHQ